MASVPYIKVTSATQTPYSMVRDSAGNYYIAAFGSLPQVQPSSSYANCLSITTIQTTSVAGGSWTPSYSGTYYNGVAYYPKKMSLFETRLFISADSGTGGFLLVNRDITSSTIYSYVYQENNNEALVSLDATAVSPTQMIVVFKNTPRATFQIMTVDFLPSSQIGLRRKILT